MNSLKNRHTQEDTNAGKKENRHIDLHTVFYKKNCAETIPMPINILDSKFALK